MRERSPPDPLDLNNLISLAHEKQSILVLQWLTECESFLSASTPEEVSQCQQTFQQAFLNLLSLPSPPIAHVLRNCLGRCFCDIFERGDRRVLFDTVSTLLQKSSQLRIDKDAKQKQYYLLKLNAEYAYLF
jgi:HEAT repeat-containing protein 5